MKHVIALEKNLLSKLKKASAIYSQLQTYQFLNRHLASSIIKLNQFTSACMYGRETRSRMCLRDFVCSWKKEAEIKLNWIKHLAKWFLLVIQF